MMFSFYPRIVVLSSLTVPFCHYLRKFSIVSRGVSDPLNYLSWTPNLLPPSGGTELRPSDAGIKFGFTKCAPGAQPPLKNSIPNIADASTLKLGMYKVI